MNLQKRKTSTITEEPSDDFKEEDTAIYIFGVWESIYLYNIAKYAVKRVHKNICVQSRSVVKLDMLKKPVQIV